MLFKNVTFVKIEVVFKLVITDISSNGAFGEYNIGTFMLAGAWSAYEIILLLEKFENKLIFTTVREVMPFVGFPYSINTFAA